MRWKSSNGSTRSSGSHRRRSTRFRSCGKDLGQIDEVLTILEVASEERDLKARFEGILEKVREELEG